MKFCTNCGTQLDDDAVFCTNCGTPVKTTEESATAQQSVSNTGAAGASASADTSAAGNPAASATRASAPDPDAAPTQTQARTSGTAQGQGPAPSQAQAPVNAPAASKASPFPTLIKLGVGLVAVVVLLMLLGSLFGGGYKKSVKNVVAAYNKQSIDSFDYVLLRDPASVGFEKDVEGIFKKCEWYEDFEEDRKDAYEDQFETIEDNYGKNWKFKVKFSDSEKLSKDDLEDYSKLLEDKVESIEDAIDWEDEDKYEDFAEAVEEEYDFKLNSSQIKKLMKAMDNYINTLKKANVQEGYEVSMVVSVKGKEDDNDWKLRKARLLKVNGDWYLVDQGNKDSFPIYARSTFSDQLLNRLISYLYK